MREILRSLRWEWHRIRHRGSSPRAAGFASGSTSAAPVDLLDAADLAAVNRLLPWHCFTVDGHGRRVGDAAWKGKRADPQTLSDPRVERLDALLPLGNRSVLEVGCFEGVHTIALSRRAGRVVAIDARVENVVKTIVRCSFYGYHPTVLKCDVESRPLPFDLLRCDVVFHVGVLYHLADPVRHLVDLTALAGEAIFLDTHVAAAGEATEEYTSCGRTVRFTRREEWGMRDPFSGTGAHSRWLLADDIVELLRDGGFGTVDLLEERQERNGTRIAVLAVRTGVPGDGGMRSEAAGAIG